MSNSTIYTKSNLIYFILIISLFGFSCKQEFFLESKNYKPIFVVDGMITNEEPACIVKLSYSSPLDFLQLTPVENCEVTITENTGKNEVLTEIEPGIYKTTEDNLHGIIGNEYMISIITPEGKEYSSEYQVMNEPIEIETINYDTTSILHIDYPFGLPGYQFFVKSELLDQHDNYFLWKLTETFEYDIDYRLGYIEDRYGDLIYDHPSFDTIVTCWNTLNVNYFYTASTENLATYQINNHPLNFVSTESKRLTKIYSLLVNQYTINKDAFEYWSVVEKQSTDENILMTSQPYTIPGNVKNINNPEELVLGYFDVASVTHKRIIVRRPKEPFYLNKCLVLVDEEAIKEWKMHHPPPYYYVEVDGIYGLLANPDCLDCRSEGGVLAKPDFWPNY